MTSAPSLTVVPDSTATDRELDASLKAAITDQDQDALRTAYDLYSGAVNGVAIGILKDPHLAADITQDVFVRLWRNPSRFDPSRGSLVAFLRMDAHGRSLDMLRSRRSTERRDRADHQLRSSEHAPGTEELAMNSVTASAVQEALMTLPTEQRTPIAMAYFDGYSYREVADQLNVPEGTIKSRIRTGMARLKTTLAVAAHA
ncbi:MAG: sigma-70 family RNA polymerase sigma factor [Acidimicrobiia bacterium]